MRRVAHPLYQQPHQYLNPSRIKTAQIHSKPNDDSNKNVNGSNNNIEIIDQVTSRNEYKYVRYEGGDQFPEEVDNQEAPSTQQIGELSSMNNLFQAYEGFTVGNLVINLTQEQYFEVLSEDEDGDEGESKFRIK